jgi:hypothetical protein
VRVKNPGGARGSLVIGLSWRRQVAATTRGATHTDSRESDHRRPLGRSGDLVVRAATMVTVTWACARPVLARRLDRPLNVREDFLMSESPQSPPEPQREPEETARSWSCRRFPRSRSSRRAEERECSGGNGLKDADGLRTSSILLATETRSWLFRPNLRRRTQFAPLSSYNCPRPKRSKLPLSNEALR